MNWHPIETAPKDGTSILIAGGTFDDDTSMGGAIQMAGVAIVSWRSCWGDEGWQGEQQAHDEYLWHSPTHWMPLPSLPTPDRSGEASETTEIGSTEGESGLPEGSSKRQGAPE